MEFAIRPEIQNFAGGLGVLATDIMKSCADMDVPIVGVSVIYHLDDDPAKGFDPSKYFEKVKETVSVKIENRDITVGAWKYEFKGLKSAVPVYFLTTFFPANERWDRDITKNLYPDNEYTRIAQEAVLGIGGLRMLRKLGYSDIKYFHMNEGHAAFLTLERLKETNYDDESVKKSCRFTTHTPVAEGHDHFQYKLAKQVLGDMLPWHAEKLAGKKYLNMTQLALSLSGKANAVSRKHRDVCQNMFPDSHFIGITNGVHHISWMSAPMKNVFNKFLRNWESDPYIFARVGDHVPKEEIQKAHMENKKILVDFINKDSECFPYPEKSLKKDDYFDAETLTITFTRRFVQYKRPLLLFRDLDRLREIGYRKLQVIYSGHCNPNDSFCNNVMGELRHLEKELRGQVRLAVMTDRNLDTTAMLASGSDIWLNNPEPPLEASGTSGMKAAINGTLNFSIGDGWWIEGYELNQLAGWTFGTDVSGHDEIDSGELYRALEDVIKCYYEKPSEWTDRMKSAITLCAYFNTNRCVEEYLEQMWSQ